MLEWYVKLFRSPRCICQRLRDIFNFKIWIGFENVFLAMTGCYQPHNRSNSNSQTANARFSPHNFRIKGDTLELFHGLLRFS
jgi:hypothetical protein